MSEWNVNHAGKTQGPFSSNQLKQFATATKITPETSVRLGKEGKWVQAKNVKGLFESRELAAVAAPTRPPLPVPSAAPQSIVAPITVVPSARVSCPYCGEDIAATAVKCRHCNEFLDGRAPGNAIPLRQEPVHVQHATTVNIQAPQRTSSLGIVSLVLGVVAFLLCWIPLIGILTLPLSALGIVLGAVALVLSIVRRGSGIGFPIAGTAVCLLALIIGFTQVAIIGSGAKAAADKMTEIENSQRTSQFHRVGR